VALGGVAGAGAGKVTAFDGEAPKRVAVQVWDSMEQIGEKYAKFRSFAVDGVAP
jgi:hypothetical protein